MTRQARAQSVGGKRTDNRVILRARHSASRVSNVRVQKHENTRKPLLHVNGQRSDMQTYAEVSTFMDNLSLYLK